MPQRKAGLQKIHACSGGIARSVTGKELFFGRERCKGCAVPRIREASLRGRLEELTKVLA